MNPCRICGNKKFEKVFELGKLPLGFPVERASALTNKIWTQKLELEICNQCLLVQTRHKIPHEKLASENLYLSESTKLVSDHDDYFLSEIPPLLSLSKGALILEIGCGDGSLLKKFWQNGFDNVIGIEPSIHPGKDYPFEIIVDFFTAKVVKDLKDSGKRPDLIISNYVLELAPDLDLFFANLKSLMKEGSYIVIEVPYFSDFLKRFRIDGFAHLRCSWFTVNALIQVFNKYNLGIIDIVHDTKYRGGTLRVISKRGHPVDLKPDLFDWKNKEREELDSSMFSRYRSKLREVRESLRHEIIELKKKEVPIYGYGGGLKASTLLNWLNLTCEEITMVVDIDPNKHNKIIPTTNIPVKPVTDLFNQKDEKIAVIILAIDHVEEVETLLTGRLGEGSIIIHLLPRLKKIIV